MRKGLGHIANREHRRTPVRHYAAKNWKRVDLPKMADLTEFTPIMPMDQGGIGSCEGHAHSLAIYTTLRAAGETLPWVPSPDALYRLARCIQRSGPSEPLSDTGTESNAVCRAANEWGIKAMGDCVQDPYDDAVRFSDCGMATLNDEPLMVDLEKEAETVVVGQYDCMGSTMAETIHNVQAAITHGVAVEIGGFVDTAYMDWTPDKGMFERCNQNDPDGGGHAQVIIGYRTVGQEVQWRIQNSWGDWCDSGRIWVSTRFLLDADELTALAVRRAS